MSDAIPQQAAASNKMACHFYRPTADVSRLHVSPVLNTMVGILCWGHGEDHRGHPLTRRCGFNP